MAVIKPLNGIAEAGTHWWATYLGHHLEKLNMVTSMYDPCLLITSPQSGHFGIVGMQTDDTISLSDEGFANLEENELQKARFKAKPKKILTCDNALVFNGCIITMDHDKSITLRQKMQGEKLQIVTNGKEYVEQRSRGAYIASICQPEAEFDLSTAAQQKVSTKEDTARLNKRIKWHMNNIDLGLRFVPLDITTIKLFVFVDGSFTNNKNLSSQLGFVIFIGNEVKSNDNFTLTGNLIHWSSTQCKRITRSVLASEIYAMTNAVDMGIAIGATLKSIIFKHGMSPISLVVCTNSFSFYACLDKLGTTKEKRLMIDITSLRQSYERREITEVRWINGRDNPADAVTKPNANSALATIVRKNKLTIRTHGWVKRLKT
ncbi:hypothetical protein K3495_g10990 [Podosphaera aphanis]|nr:hypothetical protein K3495_g10990 [Podosphaera aphanis]